jgi:hypothetical protein
MGKTAHVEQAKGLKMKTMIRSVAEASGAEYQLWAEVSACQGSGDLFAVRFSSVWTGAKDPQAPQAKGDFFLERDDLHRLQRLIEEATR